MDFSKLASNNLFLSLLSGGGAAIAGPDSIAAGMNPIIQGTIAAQSKAKEQNRQMEMLSKLLGKGVDFKSSADGKIGIGAENMEMLSSLLGGGEGGSGLGSLSEGTSPGASAGLLFPGGASGAVPDAFSGGGSPGQSGQNFDIEALKNLLNFPSSSPDVPDYADLVGLTPQDIEDALAGAQRTQQLKHNLTGTVDSTDAEYKKALTAKTIADTKKTMAELTREARKSPLDVPGLSGVTMEDWNSLDSKTKAYSYYAFDARNNNEDIMSYSEWSKQTDDPTMFQYYELSQEDPVFGEWLKEQNESKATKINIGEKVEVAEALDRVKAKTYFNDPKGLVVDVDKHLESEAVQDKLFQIQHKDGAKAKEHETVRMKEKFIDNKIKSSGGKIVDKRLDGTDFIWTVEWPDKTTSEVRYGN